MHHTLILRTDDGIGVYTDCLLNPPYFSSSNFAPLEEPYQWRLIYAVNETHTDIHLSISVPSLKVRGRTLSYYFNNLLAYPPEHIYKSFGNFGGAELWIFPKAMLITFWGMPLSLSVATALINKN